MVVRELCRRLGEQVEGSPLVHPRIVMLGRRRLGVRTR